jgi:hypothetical protein
MRLTVRCIAVLILAACTTWHAVPVTPEAYLGSMHPDQIRVTRRDASFVDLRGAVLHGDTIVGLTGSGSAHSTSRQLAVPLSSVQSIAEPKFSLSKTFGLVVVLAVPVAIVACSNSTSC